MSEAPVTNPPRGLSEVFRLANLLADRVLNAHMADHDVPDEHLRALLSASRLLEEYGQEVPPLLIPIMEQLRMRTTPDEAKPEGPAAGRE